MKKLKLLSIVYENCDSHDLTPDMFHGLIMIGIAKRYFINCFQHSGGEVNSGINCSYFGITVNSTGMNARIRGDGDKFSKRVRQFSDITHVHLYFDDGTDEYVTVPWKGDGDENLEQKVDSTKIDEIKIDIGKWE